MALVSDFVESVKTGWHALTREMFVFGGKKGTEFVVSSAGGGAAGIGGVFSVFGVGAAAAVSAVIEQIEYRHKRDKMRAFYHEEIAAKLGKPVHQVHDEDLDVMATGNARTGTAPNRTMAEHLEAERKQRNYGIFVSALAMLATIALVLSAGVGGSLLLKAVIGMACYKLVEAPLEWVGHHVLGIGQETTHDKIVALAKDHKHCKAISREQVLGVFVSANKDLQRFVQENYGASYDRLDRDAKKQAADALENVLPLTETAEHITNGTIRPMELAFTVQGEFSGVLPSKVHKEDGLVHKAGNMLKNIGHKLGIGHEKKAAAPIAAAQAPVPNHRAPVVFDNDVQTSDFGAKIMRERLLAAQRTEQPTIH